MGKPGWDDHVQIAKKIREAVEAKSVMGSQRRADWEAAIAKRKRGDDDLSGEGIWIRVGMLKHMGPAAAREEATYVVRYFRCRADLSPRSWNGPKIAENWFALEEHEAQMFLRQMIEASADPDAWEALNLIAARFHEERRPFPSELADWDRRLHRGEIHRPPKPRSNKGQPPYALHRRNKSFHQVFDFLRLLSLPKMECYAAITAGYEVSRRTVSDGIKVSRSLLPGGVLPPLQL